jgi:hypothetical protein
MNKMNKKILVFIILVCFASVSGFALTLTKQTSAMVWPMQMHGLVVSTTGFAYVLGGYSGAFGGDMFRVYQAPVDSNGVLGSWTRSTNMPGPSLDTGAYPVSSYIEPSCFEANGYVYRIGGAPNSANPLGNDNTDSLWGKIDTTNSGIISSWGSMAPFPTGVGLGGLWGPGTYAVINGTTFVYAVSGQTGYTANYVLTPKVFMSIADPFTGALSAWTEVANVPAGMWFHSAFVAQNKLYAFGGLTTSSSSSGKTDVIYKTTINADGTLLPWTTSNLPTEMFGIYGPAIAHSKHHVYWIGGRRNNTGTAVGMSTIYRATIDTNGDLGTFTADGEIVYGSSTDSRYYAPAAIAAFGKQERVYLIGGRFSFPGTTSKDYFNPNFGTDTYGFSTAVFNSEVVYTLPSAAGSSALSSGATGIYTVSNGTGPYTWTSSDSTVAQVLSYGGNSAIVQAFLSGSAVITVSDAYNDTDAVGLAVTGTDLLTIDPSIPQLMNPGTKDFTASGGTGNFVWSLSNDSVGYLSSTTGATVTFTAASAAGTVDLTVSDPGPPAQQKTVSITVIPTSAPMFKEVEPRKYIRFELFN